MRREKEVVLNRYEIDVNTINPEKILSDEMLGEIVNDIINSYEIKSDKNGKIFFLETNEIPEHILCNYAGKIDLNIKFKTQELSNEFIEKYKNKFNIKLLKKYYLELEKDYDKYLNQFDYVVSKEN